MERQNWIRYLLPSDYLRVRSGDHTMHVFAFGILDENHMVTHIHRIEHMMLRASTLSRSRDTQCTAVVLSE